LAILDIFKRKKNVFVAEEAKSVLEPTYSVGPSATYSPSRVRTALYNERTILTSVLTRMSMDVAGIPLRHAQLDDQNRYVDDVDSQLNYCLNFEPNIDQGPSAWQQDIATTLFNHGVAAIVPVDYHIDEDGNMDVFSIRIGEVTQWFPKHVKVSLYNESTGVRQEILLEKRRIAIVENPLYSVMNEPSSTLQRLTRKLQLLDVVDEQSSSGKLDLIIQLPYAIKSETRRKQAEQRKEDIEFQLKGSQYGIAYTDATEKITQLNRPAENNLLKQVEYLSDLLYSQLGIDKTVMSGTADEATMINYYSRTIEPILNAIVQAMQRSILGRDLLTKKRQRIMYFRDPFKLVPIGNIAEIADKFTRNEIVSSNEFRGFMGLQPSKDPKADQLINSNMPQPAVAPAAPPGPSVDDMDSMMDEVFKGLTADVDAMVKGDG
jgi:Phage portal protein